MGELAGELVFWGVAAALALAVTGLMVAALARGRATATTAAQDLRVYRDQLKEVDRDLARGVIGPDEAARLRTEIGRRVLAADAAARAPQQTVARDPGRPVVAALMAVTVLAVGGGVYAMRGAPGQGDLPMAFRLAEAERARAARPAQAEAEARVTAALPPVAPPADARHADLLDQLRRVMAERPNDLQGQELLARNEAMVGNLGAAARAQAMVVALKGPAATADDLAAQAELMVGAAGGMVSPEAEAVLAAALTKDNSNGPARYLSGLMFIQTGRPDMTFRFWAPLWESSAPDDPWVPALRDQLPDVAWLAGQHRYEMPALRAPLPGAPLPGPDAAAVEAAQDMTPEARQQMVRGMVDGLLDRLATSGGTATEWARAIQALGVLGDLDRARAIHAEALTRFAGRADDLAEIATAATAAGLQ